MKRNDKQRLFEVMHRLDKTFKLNENADGDRKVERYTAYNGNEIITILEYHADEGGFYNAYSINDKDKLKLVKYGLNRYNDDDILKYYKGVIRGIYENDELNQPDVNPTQTQVPSKLYVFNGLTSTAKFLVDNAAYIPHFNNGTNNKILAYRNDDTIDSDDGSDFVAIGYEFDTAKMMALGFEILDNTNFKLRGNYEEWEITVPNNYAHNNTLRLINQYMSKVIINFEEFAKFYDLKNIDDYYQKFGKPTVPVEFTNAPTEKYKPIGLSHFGKNLINFNENKK